MCIKLSAICFLDKTPVVALLSFFFFFFSLARWPVEINFSLLFFPSIDRSRRALFLRSFLDIEILHGG